MALGELEVVKLENVPDVLVKELDSQFRFLFLKGQMKIAWLVLDIESLTGLLQEVGAD